MKRPRAKMHIVFQGGKVTFRVELGGRMEKEKLSDALAHLQRPIDQMETVELIESYKRTIRYALSHNPLDDARSILENFAAATVSKFPAHQIIWEIITAADDKKSDELIKELSAVLKKAREIRRINELPPLISQRIKASFGKRQQAVIEKDDCQRRGYRQSRSAKR